METRRKWSDKYKKSINCRAPKGFSQRQHCTYGRTQKKKPTRPKNWMSRTRPITR